MPTLTLTFTEASPVPPFGYVVRYREVGTPLYWKIEPNPTHSPIQIVVPAGKKWEGSIRAQMDENTLCDPKPWVYDDTINSLNSILASVSTFEGGVCSTAAQNIYSNGLTPGGVPIQGVEIFFDSSGIVSVGDGFIKGTDDIIYIVTNGIIGAPTGNSC